MASSKLSPLELRIMNVLWSSGALSIREIQEALPANDRPAYTTVQTTVYRMEAKGAVRRTRKISNAHIFEAVVSRSSAQHRLLDDVLALFGGGTQPLMARLVESGRLTIDDLRDAERLLKQLKRKEKSL